MNLSTDKFANQENLPEAGREEGSSQIFILFTKRFELIWDYSDQDLRKKSLARPGEYLGDPIAVQVSAGLNDLLKAEQARRDEELLDRIIEELHADMAATAASDEVIPRITPEQEVEALARLAAWKKQFPDETDEDKVDADERDADKGEGKV